MPNQYLEQEMVGGNPFGIYNPYDASNSFNQFGSTEGGVNGENPFSGPGGGGYGANDPTVMNPYYVNVDRPIGMNFGEPLDMIPNPLGWNDPNVINSAAGRLNDVVLANQNAQNQSVDTGAGSTQASRGQLNTGGQITPPIFIPGIGVVPAIIASIILSGGNLNPLNGGASPTDVVNSAAGALSNPAGTLSQTGATLAAGAGLIDLNGNKGSLTISPGALGGATSGTSGTGGGGPTSGPNQEQNTSIIGLPVTGPNGTTGLPAPIAGPGPLPKQDNGNVAIFNPGGGDSGSRGAGETTPSDPIAPIATPNAVTPTTPTTTLPTVNPENNNNKDILPVATPTTPTTPPPAIFVAPTITSNSNMATINPPDNRNYLQEGGLGNTAYNQLGQGIYGNYAQFAPQYGQNDLNSLQALYGNTNANTLGGINKSAYGAMQGTLSGDLQNMAQQQLGLGSSLSQQQIRDSQQATRAADSARGLVMGPNSVGNEVLNQDRYGQQLLQQRQAFAASVNPQLMQNAVQMNQMGTDFLSGRNSNQYVQNQANPFNQYANDVYGSNFNAGNAQYISGQNNAAALESGKQIQNTNYTDMFMNALYGIGKGKGWFG